MTFKLNEEKMYLDSAEGMTVVIDFTSGGYFGFSTLGSFIVEKLAHGVSDEDIVASVSVLSGCPQSFRKDLDTFVDQLLTKQILTKVGENASSGVIQVDDSAVSDGFELKLIENSDLKDLIMADPVHDVDPSAGWPFMK